MMDDTEQLYIETEDHMVKMKNVLLEMVSKEEQCDVTLVSEDDMEIRAHKVILSLKSEKFRKLFNKYTDRSSVIMSDYKYEDLIMLRDFIYRLSSHGASSRNYKYAKTSSRKKRQYVFQKSIATSITF